jgi:hypothetical protein
MMSRALYENVLTTGQTRLDILKKYVGSQGEEDIENKYIKRKEDTKEDNNCHLCGWS